MSQLHLTTAHKDSISEDFESMILDPEYLGESQEFFNEFFSFSLNELSGTQDFDGNPLLYGEVKDDEQIIPFAISFYFSETDEELNFTIYDGDKLNNLENEINIYA